MEKYTRDDAIRILREKYESLGRLPKRADLTESEIVAIKAFLGPLPRALEEAGLKEPVGMSSLEKNRIKRKIKKAKLKSNKKGEQKS